MRQDRERTVPMVVKEAKTTVATLTLDGETVTFSDGDTLYQVAERNRKDIPTLCYDPRLEAFGARLCTT